MKNIIESIVNILSNPNTDYKAIALEVARKYPQTFLKCAGCPTVITNKENDAAHALAQMTSIEQKIFPIIKYDKIQAIKTLRTITGISLMEAKHACDSMQDKWIKDGLLK